VFASLSPMRASDLAALGCFLVAGCSLFVGEEALADARDVSALYWLLAGSVSLRASLALVGKPGS